MVLPYLYEGLPDNKWQWQARTLTRRTRTKHTPARTSYTLTPTRVRTHAYTTHTTSWRVPSGDHISYLSRLHTRARTHIRTNYQLNECTLKFLDLLVLDTDTHAQSHTHT